MEITSRSDSVWRRSPPAAGKAQTCWTAPGIQFQSASVAEDDDYDDDEEDDLEASVNEGELFFQPACRLLLAGLSVRVHLNMMRMLMMILPLQADDMIINQIDDNNDHLLW